MPMFRKKPVVIEAIRWDGLNLREVMDFMGWRNADHDEWHGLNIRTLEGTHHATPGDYVIKGVKGEFYPCKPDIFAATYEPADAPGELSDLRASNARMCDVLASVRERLGLDDGGSVLEAIDELKRKQAEHHVLKGITLNGEPLDLSGYPKDIPVVIDITNDPNKPAGVYAGRSQAIEARG